MTDTNKHKIATAFPDKFYQTTLAIEISISEFKIFENGIFAESMDDKWNIFVNDSQQKQKIRSGTSVRYRTENDLDISL